MDIKPPDPSTLTARIMVECRSNDILHHLLKDFTLRLRHKLLFRRKVKLQLHHVSKTKFLKMRRFLHRNTHLQTANSSEHSQFDSNIEFWNPAAAARIRKTYIPSDDEDDEDEEEVESSESEEEDGEKSPLPVRQVKPSTPVQSTDEDDQKSKNKATRKQPLPSDDESSAEGKHYMTLSHHVGFLKASL
jgi:hypothetical protein